MAETNNELDFPSIATSEIDESMQDLYFAQGGSPSASTDALEDIDEDANISFDTNLDTTEGQYFDDSEEEPEDTTLTLSTPKPKEVPKKEEEKVPEEATTVTPEVTTEDTAQVDFQSIAQEFFTLGILTTDEGEEEQGITTQDQLLERFQYEKEKSGIKYVYDNIISKHGDEGIKMFNSIFIDGMHPEDYFQTTSTTLSLKNYDLTDDQNKRTIFAERLRQQGYSEDTIKRHVNRSFELGELEEDAKEAHEFLLKQQEAIEAQKLEQAKVIELQKKQFKDLYLTNVKTEITNSLKKRDLGNLPITDKAARELEDYLTTETHQLKTTGEKLTKFDIDILSLRDPKNHSKKVVLAYLWKMYEKDPFLSTIKKKGVSEASNTMFNSLVRKDKTQTAKQSQFGLNL